MPVCEHCADETGDPFYTCTYCYRTHCKEHRLPENHDCPELDAAGTLGPEFREGSPIEVSTSRSTGRSNRLAAAAVLAVGVVLVVLQVLPWWVLLVALAIAAALYFGLI